MARRVPPQLIRDAKWIMSFAPGTPWSRESGFRPRREAELVALGVLVPTPDGFTVAHVDLSRIHEIQ